MLNLNEKHQRIIRIFLEKGKMQSSDVHNEMVKRGFNISLITVKRTLSQMTSIGVLLNTGSGRSTSYEISSKGRIFANVDAKQYCSIEPDKRHGLSQYNFDLLSAVPSEIFSEIEIKKLDKSTTDYKKRTKDLPSTIKKKELERLIIELSWKSSKIEGNTYTLLDTEKLILENKEAPGHSKQETQMILNHKDAFNYIHENPTQFKAITRKNLEELHSILVKNLSIGLGLRQRLVGVTGSIYRPLDNGHQITDAIGEFSKTVSQIQNPYAKALIVLLGISYIQPFEDGNKRTARIMTNAILLAYSLAPLSYRSVDENDYREAMLVFYELNSIIPLKKIFVEQYEFAAHNYAAK